MRKFITTKLLKWRDKSAQKYSESNFLRALTATPFIAWYRNSSLPKMLEKFIVVKIYLDTWPLLTDVTSATGNGVSHFYRYNFSCPLKIFERPCTLADSIRKRKKVLLNCKRSVEVLTNKKPKNPGNHKNHKKNLINYSN